MYSTSTLSKMIVEDHTGINSESEGSHHAANQYSVYVKVAWKQASPVVLMQHVIESPSDPCPSHTSASVSRIFILPVRERNCSWICLVAPPTTFICLHVTVSTLISASCTTKYSGRMLSCTRSICALSDLCGMLLNHNLRWTQKHNNMLALVHLTVHQYF